MYRQDRNHNWIRLYSLRKSATTEVHDRRFMRTRFRSLRCSAISVWAPLCHWNASAASPVPSAQQECVYAQDQNLRRSGTRYTFRHQLVFSKAQVMRYFYYRLRLVEFKSFLGSRWRSSVGTSSLPPQSRLAKFSVRISLQSVVAYFLREYDLISSYEKSTVQS